MARPWRIQYPDAVYHVMSRGVNRGKLFHIPSDYQRFITCLQRVSEKFDLNVFAFALMGNHYHLLLRTPKGNLSRAMQWLQAAYSAYFNHKNRRFGHLFQGRYKSILVEDESYWTGLSYYIHLNPIRAKMVTDLSKYPWSSYSAYINKTKDSWLYSEEILRQFGRSRREQIRNYRQTIREISGKEKSILGDLKFGFILGGKEFVDRLFRKFMPKKNIKEVPVQKQIRDNGIAEKVIEATAKKFKVKKEQITRSRQKRENHARDASLYILYNYTGLTNGQIGKEFNLSPTAVCKASIRLKDRMARKKRLRRDVRQAVNSVFKT